MKLLVLADLHLDHYLGQQMDPFGSLEIVRYVVSLSCVAGSNSVKSSR